MPIDITKATIRSLAKKLLGSKREELSALLTDEVSKHGQSLRYHRLKSVQISIGQAMIPLREMLEKEFGEYTCRCGAKVNHEYEMCRKCQA